MTETAEQQSSVETTTDNHVDVWFGAHALCLDHDAGHVSGFICTERSPRLRSLVVRDSHHEHGDYPVALSHVGTSRHGTVDLDVTVAQVRERSHGVKTVVVSADPVWWMDTELVAPSWRFKGHEAFTIPVTVPDLDPGDVLVTRQASVVSGDDYVGTLAGLRARRDDGEITAVIVDVGHVWHHHQVLVPAARLEKITPFSVHLRDA